jgi:hypothetical protein
MIGAITVDTASIETSTVTINTLTINGKQVTLDIFRQLMDAVLINHDGTFAGPPWGMVNYHLDKKVCDKLQKHAHVVWQLGDELRQDTIQPPRWEPYRSDTCDALVFAAGTMERFSSVITWSDPPPEDPVRPRQSRPSWPRLAARAILMLFQPPPDPLQPPPEEPEQAPPEEPEEPAGFRWNRPNFGRMGRREGVDELIFRLDSIDGIECSGDLRPYDDRWGGPELAAEHSAADPAGLAAQLREEIAAEKERRARHEASWAEILDLPQLFIAG